MPIYNYNWRWAIVVMQKPLANIKSDGKGRAQDIMVEAMDIMVDIMEIMVDIMVEIMVEEDTVVIVGEEVEIVEEEVMVEEEEVNDYHIINFYKLSFH